MPVGWGPNPVDSVQEVWARDDWASSLLATDPVSGRGLRWRAGLLEWAEVLEGFRSCPHGSEEIEGLREVK